MSHYFVIASAAKQSTPAVDRRVASLLAVTKVQPQCVVATAAKLCLAFGGCDA